MELTYDMPIRFPFLNKRFSLYAISVERVWIGNTDDTTSSLGDGNPSPIKLIYKPSPAYKGNEGTIRAKITPGMRAQLIVYYKSGESISKNVGWAKANGEGEIKWTWLISGNTTTGTWSFSIVTEDGGYLEDTFQVFHN